MPRLSSFRKGPKSTPRTFRIGPVSAAASPFCSNTIKTAKYNLKPWSIDFFIYKNLFEQFMRLANMYFLIIGILQLIPGLSPTGRFSTGLTLVFVLAVSAMKAAYEDWKRHRSDTEVNGREITVLSPEGIWVKTQWRNLSVGNIVKVVRGKEFPADLLLVASSEQEGVAYVETANLDGETNLKRKQALACTLPYDTQEKLGRMEGSIEVEGPNRRLYEITGTLKLTDLQGNSEVESLEIDQILLRGSRLRKSEHAIGVVIYTGTDTRIMQNSSKPPHKRSTVEKNVNSLLFFIFALQLVLVVFSSFMITVFPVKDKWYLQWERNKITLFFSSLPTFLILYNNLIPISLYVSMELVKFGQGWFIYHDLEIYYAPKNMPALAHTTSLNEELGQVHHIFSDKTGTLTRNVMKFFKFSVAGEPFGKGTTEIGRAAAKRTGKQLVDERPAHIIESESQFWDERVNDGAWQKHPLAPEIREFFSLLAICHTVVMETTPSGSSKIQAESPDESALVSAANAFGFEFLDRLAGDVLLLKVQGQEIRLTLRNVLEFNSDRKRMSTIVEDSDGNITLYCKGADNMMWPRVKPNCKYIPDTQHQLRKFGDEGLRTLVCAKLPIPRSVYDPWQERWLKAKCIIGKERNTKLQELAEEIETGMDYVGSSAIEDKLQDGVPETIERLRSAGIKVWMLTGDKQETAINIGYACALVNTAMETVILNQTDTMQLQSQIEAAIASYVDTPHDKEVATVIGGDTLHHVFQDEATMQSFRRLACASSSVICCRATPLQKADVVTMMRQDKQLVSLAIGDGANDVSMIQAAHVGVGISGMEGQQAANSADYAIGQFRYLYRLMLVHGRWNYRRLTKLILYSFYKNIALYLTQLCFLVRNGWSGQTLYDQYVLSLYNALFTFFPVLVLGIWDRDIGDQQKLYEYPQLYQIGINNTDFTAQVFCGWLINAIYHAIICFGIPTIAIESGILVDGDQYGVFANGTIIYTCVVLVVNLKLALEMEAWTVLHHISIWGSILVWYIFLLIYGELFFMSVEMYHMFLELIDEPKFWFISIITVFIALARDFLWKYHTYNLRSAENMELYKKIRVHEANYGHSTTNDNVPPSVRSNATTATHNSANGTPHAHRGDVSHALHSIQPADTGHSPSGHGGGKEAWSDDSKESTTRN